MFILIKFSNILQINICYFMIKKLFDEIHKLANNSINLKKILKFTLF
jgi:hypothetical protein